MSSTPSTALTAFARAPDHTQRRPAARIARALEAYKIPFLYGTTTTTERQALAGLDDDDAPKLNRHGRRAAAARGDPPAAPDPEREAIAALLPYGALFPTNADNAPMTKHGFEDAASTAEGVAELAAAYPHRYGWGFVPKPGFMVLDIDRKNGKDGLATLRALEAEHGELAPTFEWKTRSDGLARLYTTNGVEVTKSEGRTGVGLDIRAVNGYQVAPPTPGYEFIRWAEPAAAPAWLVKSAQTSAKQTAKPKAVACAVEDADWQIRKARRFLAERLHNEPSGEDGHRFALACQVRDFGLSEPTALVAMSAWNEQADYPRDANEIEKAVANAYRYAQNAPGAAVAAFAHLIEPEDAEPGPEADDEPPKAPPRLAPQVTMVEITGGKDIPPRPWVYGKHLQRRTVSVTAAHGGVGKTSLAITDALAMATGRDLLGTKPVDGPHRVLLVNREDGHDELRRRIEAAASLHGITTADLGGRLHLVSRDDCGDLLFVDADGRVPNGAAEAGAKEIMAIGADVVIFDPLVSFHEADENSNPAMDRVIKTAAKIASMTECAIDLVHHSAKGSARDQDKTAAARGASSIVDGCRAMRVLTRMSTDEAPKLGVDKEDRVRYVRQDNAKANMAPLEKARWFELVDISLDNAAGDYEADHVGAIRRWVPPSEEATQPEAVKTLWADIAAYLDEDPLGRARTSRNTNNAWIGHAVAEFADLGETRVMEDAECKANRTKAAGMVKDAVAAGILEVAYLSDANSDNRPCYRVTAAARPHG